MRCLPNPVAWNVDTAEAASAGEQWQACTDRNCSHPTCVPYGAADFFAVVPRVHLIH
jgi:hypothetical protein